MSSLPATPLVSVIVRTKDRPELLLRALCSIAAQDYRPLEVVLVNDGGKPLDMEAAAEALGDVSLNYIAREQSRGRANAANAGIEAASGTYFIMLDDDDEYSTDHVSTLVRVSVKDPEAIHYAGCEVIHCDGEGVPIKDKRQTLSKEFSRDILLAKNFIPFMCTLFPRSVVLEAGGIDEGFELYEDWDLLIRLSFMRPFKHMDKITAKYYIWDTGEQLTEQARQDGLTGTAYARIYEKHKDKITKETIEALVREQDKIQAVMQERILGVIAEKNEEKRDAVNILNEIIRNTAGELNIVIEQKNSDIAELELAVAERELRLSEIYSSQGWQLLLKYRGLKEKMLPVGTRRRRLYELVLQGVVVLRTEGLLRFFQKAKNKLGTEFSQRPATTPEFLTKRPEPLEFSLREDPEVSIIIPVYNKSLYTFNCLESILKHTKESSYEVVVMDNASTDDTEEMLSQVQNIKVIRNEENQGFVGACNLGAENSQGKYLLFLNNDVQVRPLWLYHLLEVFRKHEDAGLVGSKLIYPDGRLQEAGGIFWNDGSACNYGKFDDPEKPEYNYLRDTCYCSGASIIISKDLFKRAGGFDKRYSPAYYEDTDMACTVRELGYRVIYQPASVVTHFEGLTAGSDLSLGLKKYQVGNRLKFVKKWKEMLEAKHLPPGQDLYLARETDFRERKRMLFVDHYVPTYDKDAGSARTFEYLKVLVALGFKITFWPDNLARLQPYTFELQQMGIEVIYGRRDFRGFIAEFGRHFDVAFLSRAHIAVNYIDTIKTLSSMKVVYDFHDLAYLREMRQAELEGSKKILENALKKKAGELALAIKSDACVVMSSFEKEVLLEENPAIRTYHLPLIYPAPGNGKIKYEDTEGLFFVGGFAHAPNEDGVMWFVQEVLPLVHRELPDVVFTIVGSNPPKAVRELASERVRVAGFVKDISPYFLNSRVFVAPLRFGAGVKGKVIQSMGFGLPVVTTPIGAEGMDMQEGSEILTAEGAEEFARKVVDLYGGKALWEELSRNSASAISKRFSPEAVRKKFLTMFMDIGVFQRDYKGL